MDAPLEPLRCRSLVLATYGRSGSTLLQGILNTIPGMVIRGENQEFAYGLFLASQRLAQAHATARGASPPPDSPRSPWFLSDRFDVAAFRRRVADLLRATLLDGLPGPDAIRCVGFKEVRYVDCPEPGPYLGFLADALEEPLFVFLTRERAQVLRSGWWPTREIDAANRQIDAIEAVFADFAARHPAISHAQTYADLVGTRAQLRQLFERIGAPFDPEVAEAVLARPHSYQHRSVKFGPRGIALHPEDYRDRLLDVVLHGVERHPDALRVQGAAIAEPPHAVAGLVACTPAGTECADGEVGLTSREQQRRFPHLPGSDAAGFRIAVPADRRGATELQVVFADGARRRIVTIAGGAATRQG